MIIGLISDTHGMVRPAVRSAFAGVDLILHAGDVGGRHVIDELAMMAPVLAVAGNTDVGDETSLPAALDRGVGGLRLHLSHGHEVGRPTAEILLARYPADIIVFGHTHRSLVHFDGRRLVVNPGAAGRRRFGIAPTAARLTIDGSDPRVEIVRL